MCINDIFNTYYFLILIYHRHIFDIKSFSLHLLLLMNIMLVFMYMDFAELSAMESNRKIQN